MKKLVLYSASILLGVGAILGGAVGYGWYAEMAYTSERQASYDRANHAMHEGESNPNRHIIRPPVEDRSYYK